MKAVILSAGRGLRLGALGKIQPKCLLKFGDSSILEHQCNALLNAGIEEIIIVAGFMIESIRDFSKGRYNVVENPKYKSTGSLYSLWCAKEHLGSDGFLVVNGDVIHESELINRFVNHHIETACLIDEVRPFVEGEYHVVMRNRCMKQYDTDVKEEDSIGQCAQMYKVGSEDTQNFMQHLNSAIKNGHTDKYSSFPLEPLMETNSLRPIFTNDNIWLEIDTADDYNIKLPAFQNQMQQRIVVKDNRTNRLNAQKGGFRSVGHFFSETALQIKNRKLSNRMRWLPPFMWGITHKPIKTWKLFYRLVKGEISSEGFNLQLCGIDFLKAVLAVCKTLDLKPFLAWGSLLGCVRDSRFIDDDHDIDLAMLKEDFKKINQLRDALIELGYNIRLNAKSKLSIYHPLSNGLFIDIDVAYEKNHHMVITSCQHNGKVVRSHYFAKKAFASFKTTQFMGIEVLIPANPEMFLESVYGNWQKRQTKEEWPNEGLNLLMEQVTLS